MSEENTSHGYLGGGGSSPETTPLVEDPSTPVDEIKKGRTEGSGLELINPKEQKINKSVNSESS